MARRRVSLRVSDLMQVFCLKRPSKLCPAHLSPLSWKIITIAPLMMPCLDQHTTHKRSKTAAAATTTTSRDLIMNAQSDMAENLLLLREFEKKSRRENGDVRQRDSGTYILYGRERERERRRHPHLHSFWWKELASVLTLSLYFGYSVYRLYYHSMHIDDV